MGLVVVLVVNAPGDSDSPSAWFLAVWLAIALWNGYWFLFRFAYRLRVADNVLHWGAPLRRGSVPVADIVALRPWRVVGSNVEVIETASDETIPVFVDKGLDEFARALSALNPSMTYRFGLLGKLAMRMPWGRSRFHEE
jgi:hypothetical protein